MTHYTSLFCEAEAIQREQGNRRFLYSLAGFRYCDLLLDQGSFAEVLERASEALEITSTSYQSLSDEGLALLCFGRVGLKESQAGATRHLDEASRNLDNALLRFRQAKDQEFIVQGLLSQAELHHVTGAWAEARRDVDEAFTIATRGGMRLHETDCHLEYARLYLACAEKHKAQESLAKANRMIEEMGYHRRDKEVRELEAQL